MIRDPGAAAVTNAGTLRELFGLTQAEAQLATALHAGDNPRRYAERCGRSLHTVRSQLRDLLGKTGTHSQTALLQLLAAITMMAN